MKKLGFLAALTVASTIACGGGRDDATSDTREDTIGTGGEVADNTAATPDTRADRTTGDVQRWVQDISTHNMAEIELGKLASERGGNAEVKKYGQMMVRDHTAAGNELKQAVGGQVQLQEQMDEKHRDLAQKLRGLRGAEFDREYMNAMVEGHEEVKGMLEDRARNASTTTGTAGRPGTTADRTTGTANRPGTTGDNAQLETAVNQWAAKTLPKVEQHLKQAEQLRDRVQSGGRTTQNNPTNRNTMPNTRDQ